MHKVTMNTERIYEKVQDHYGSAAAAQGGDGDYGKRVAKSFGYSQGELESIPQGANLGLSCGNPLALANLKEGETVIDLGSGAGFDVFLAARKIGSSGKAIGIDMNKNMLKRANQLKEKANADNVSFIESLITDIALTDAVAADCIISNCVVNLVPEPERYLAFHEMFRLLKPGGRVAISDILAKRELPPKIKSSMALYVGCIAGASQVKDYENYLLDAGFTDILIVDSKRDLNIYKMARDDDTSSSSSRCCGDGVEKSCCDKSTPSCCTNNKEPTSESSSEPVFKSDFEDFDYNEFAGSFKIYAIKA